MSTGVGLPNVGRLNENDYDTWKVHMNENVYLWRYVCATEECKKQNPQQRIKKDVKVLAIIQLRVSPSQLNYIKKAETFKQARDALRRAFESSFTIRKVTLCKQLLRTKKTQNSTTQHVNPFSDILHSLAEAGLALSEELLSIMLLFSLSEYENFCTAMESRDDMPTMD